MGERRYGFERAKPSVTLVHDRSEWSDPHPDLLTEGMEPPVCARHDTDTDALERKERVGLPSN